ncbi:hypothetical protein [Fibrella aquatica]|jgi:hypothetical protein|uniref:hypothetical protein n=1 Tax=Fibrella aquatica TaxID=3242487 RepID=UPI003522CD11
METDAQSHLQKLLPFFNRSPVAMAETSIRGDIRQVNPKAVQLIMPLAMHLGLPGDNLLDTLGGFLPQLNQTVTEFPAESGLVIGQEPYVVRFSVGQSLIERHFNLTIEKNTADSLIIFFEDVTDFLLKADALRQQS